jgi:hypothetical protein
MLDNTLSVLLKYESDLQRARRAMQGPDPSAEPTSPEDLYRGGGRAGGRRRRLDS